MKLTIISLAVAFTGFATAGRHGGGGGRAKTYPGDIVGYWNERVDLALNNSSPKLSSLRESYVGGLVATSVLAAADASEGQSRGIRQLAISYAAHDTLVRTFQNQYRSFDLHFRAIEDAVELSAKDAAKARALGEGAAYKTYISRAGDGVDKYIRYDFKSPGPGVYQPTPPNNVLPADPNGQFHRPFGGLKKIDPWKAPPNPRSKEYVKYLQTIKDKGARTGSTRTPEETEIGLYWLESSQTWWNRFARTIIGDRFKDDISEAARFYALLNWSIANSGILGWQTKIKYNTWRPITALHYPHKYLHGGKRIYDPNWQPLAPTPSHQDYLSGHAVYAEGAAEIIRKYLKSDRLPKPIKIGSLVTLDNVGWIYRTFTSLSQASLENGVSRVYVGVHFGFASDEGIKGANKIAKETWAKGTKNYL